jgi:hypothetical protein
MPNYTFTMNENKSYLSDPSVNALPADDFNCTPCRNPCSKERTIVPHLSSQILDLTQEIIYTHNNKCITGRNIHNQSIQHTYIENNTTTMNLNQLLLLIQDLYMGVLLQLSAILLCSRLSFLLLLIVTIIQMRVSIIGFPSSF